MLRAHAPAEVEEDDVVEHRPPDRHRRAVRVDHVDAHRRDEAVGRGFRDGVADLLLLDLVRSELDRPVAKCQLLWGRRGGCGERERGDREASNREQATGAALTRRRGSVL